VLSGILAAVAALHGDRPAEAAAAAAWINGRAGEKARDRMGDVSMTAGDTAAALPEVLQEISLRG
jgi:NAD(P)H-hydrate repair Nnr-like enzyme with NAD(P)H-hydrate dehydratase domain